MSDKDFAPAGWTARPVHGGIRPAELRALGLNPADALDFSAGVSPLGPPAGLWAALQAVDLTAYPDPECLELREALGRHTGADPDTILVGNGSTELIHILARTYLSPPRAGCANAVLLLTPTYGEYAGAGALAGAELLTLAAQRDRDFAWDLEQAAALIQSRRPSLVFLCNPNNPTGGYLSRGKTAALAAAVAQAGGLLVLDEAYINFVADAWDARALRGPAGGTGDNLVILRSMTKDYALTGLRLGYALASPAVTERLAARQPDWSVNALAQAAGLAALADADYLPQARAAAAAAKDCLTRELTAQGYGVLPSAANFLLVSVGNGAAVRERLMRRGLFVRDCASFGLPDCIRIGLRPLPDCQRLAAALGELGERGLFRSSDAGLGRGKGTRNVE